MFCPQVLNYAELQASQQFAFSLLNFLISFLNNFQLVSNATDAPQRIAYHQLSAHAVALIKSSPQFLIAVIQIWKIKFVKLQIAHFDNNLLTGQKHSIR